MYRYRIPGDLAKHLGDDESYECLYQYLNQQAKLHPQISSATSNGAKLRELLNTFSLLLLQMLLSGAYSVDVGLCKEQSPVLTFFLM